MAENVSQKIDMILRELFLSEQKNIATNDLWERTDYKNERDVKMGMLFSNLNDYLSAGGKLETLKNDLQLIKLVDSELRKVSLNEKSYIDILPNSETLFQKAFDDYLASIRLYDEVDDMIQEQEELEALQPEEKESTTKTVDTPKKAVYTDYNELVKDNKPKGWLYSQEGRLQFENAIRNNYPALKDEQVFDMLLVEAVVETYGPPFETVVISENENTGKKWLREEFDNQIVNLIDRLEDNTKENETGLKEYLKKYSSRGRYKEGDGKKLREFSRKIYDLAVRRRTQTKQYNKNKENENETINSVGQDINRTEAKHLSVNKGARELDRETSSRVRDENGLSQQGIPKQEGARGETSGRGGIPRGLDGSKGANQQNNDTNGLELHGKNPEQHQSEMVLNGSAVLGDGDNGGDSKMELRLSDDGEMDRRSNSAISSEETGGDRTQSAGQLRGLHDEGRGDGRHGNTTDLRNTSLSSDDGNTGQISDVRTRNEARPGTEGSEFGDSNREGSPRLANGGVDIQSRTSLDRDENGFDGGTGRYENNDREGPHRGNTGSERGGDTVQISGGMDKMVEEFELETADDTKRSLPNSDKKEKRTGENIDFSTNSEPSFEGLVDRYSKNIEAIKLNKLLNEEFRFATKDEQVTLSLYSGWGGLSSVFNSKEPRWEARREELKTLISKSEFENAKASSLDAYYTPKLIIDSIYKGLDRLGFNQDNNEKDIFEPSAGIGNFLAHAKNYSNKYSFSATELDTLSSSILKNLYPNQITENQSFESFDFQRQYDAFIGNPPFGQKKIFDYKSEFTGQSVHNFFIGKSIEKLKEDGIAAFVVSSAFLDAKTNKTRYEISKKATFLGAVRLPNGAFKDNTNTDVQTDIVFFKKGVDPSINKDFINSYSKYSVYDFSDYELSQYNLSEEKMDDLSMNEYFHNNPQNILGQTRIISSQYGATLGTIDNGVYSEKRLNAFIDNLPENVYRYHKTEFDENYEYLSVGNANYQTFKDITANLKIGNAFEFNGKFYKLTSNSERSITLKRLNTLKPIEKGRLRLYFKVRDSFNKQINLEKSIEASEEEVENNRKILNENYTNMVEDKKHGFHLKNARKSNFIKDCDMELYKLRALETFLDKGISKNVAKKQGIEAREAKSVLADIFTKRVINKKVELKIETSLDALTASLNKYGIIKPDYMAEILPSKPKDEIMQELLVSGELFVNHNNKDEYILAPTYLGGNVKERYKEVSELINKGDTDLALNLQALKEVLPKDIKASDIDVTCGVPWVPKEYYQQFISEHFKVDSAFFGLAYNHFEGSWRFKAFNEWRFQDKDRYNIYHRDDKKQHSPIFSYDELIAKAFNAQSIVITEKVPTGEYVNGREKVKNVILNEETTVANQKLKDFTNAFEDWIFKDPERREKLERIYNDTFNTNVPVKYDGSSMEFAELNSSFTLRPHQKDAIKRAVQEQTVLFDHQVGAGKTLVAITSIMEQKRMGLINKPLVIVPNHITKQWEKEFYQAYPNANILVPSQEEMSQKNTEEFFAKIASNDYDAIILPHSKVISLPPDFESYKKTLEEEIKLAELTISEQKSEGTSARGNKNRLFNLQNKLEDELRKEQSGERALSFSDLGVDALIVDESHEFKNLSFITAMNSVRGLGNPNGSEKANIMKSWTDYIHRENKKLVFLTGTPVSNSFSELYGLQRYLDPKSLKDKGIECFDAWAKTFGKVTTEPELGAGNKYKVISRFTSFQNMPELIKMYQGFADIIKNKDIEKYQKNYVPKLYNDKPIPVVCERSQIQADFNELLIKRLENPRNNIDDNPLKITSEARAAALDFRLLNPEAEDFENSKINTLVSNLFTEYERTNDVLGTQLAFCDLGTPKTKSYNINLSGGEDIIDIVNNPDSEDEEKESEEFVFDNFNVYSDVYKKLVAKGIPREEIAFIHDATTNEAKANLFKDVNAGKIRILLGSSSKMGAGTNVQERITAIHHLDCPWRPSDIAQRNGRAIRQGNKLHQQDPENFRIREFRYSTEATYDAVFWQIQENKGKTIEQLGSAHYSLDRRINDFTAESTNATTMKAVTSGNPLIIECENLKQAYRETKAMSDLYNNRLYAVQDKNKLFPGKIELEKKILEKYKSCKESLDKHDSSLKGNYYRYDSDGNVQEIPFSITSEQTNANKLKKDELIKAFKENVKETIFSEENGGDRKIFNYRGLSVGVIANSTQELQFYIDTPNGDFIEPYNLKFKKEGMMPLDESVTFSSFLTKLNNFYKTKIDEHIEYSNQHIVNMEIEFKNSIQEEKSIENGFDKKEYLEALKDDVTNIQIVIDRGEKEFTPKSKAILESLNKKQNLIREKEKGLER